MEIPRGHAMLPLSDADFLDFIYNYFKAEYAPIRSFWATATAEPRHPQRWMSMGHELAPLGFRPANAQAQKDLEALDFFLRQRNLDASFVRGIVIRFAKYEVHERLEKKLFESCRLDLMVRKALKEKHLIDALWPSPAPRSIKPELLQQGVRVRQYYGDMISKYFRHLHAVDDFTLRPDIDAKIKSSSTLMLVPFVDHLVFGAVDPIMPIVAKGAGYANAAAWKQKDRGGSFGNPDRFEIRFDAPTDLSDTHTKSVVRQCQCLKCGSWRDVTVVISVDPVPGPVTSGSQDVASTKMASNLNTSAPRRRGSKVAQKYSPGYVMPGSHDGSHRVPNAQPPEPQTATSEARPPSPAMKKQCARCTFLNHPDLSACEMCAADLPDSSLVTKPPSPDAPQIEAAHSHSSSLSPPALKEPSSSDADRSAGRPALSRHSLSSTLFAIFPFNQQQQSEHKPNLPVTQPTESAKGETSTPVIDVTHHDPNPKPREKSHLRGEKVESPRARTSGSHVDPPSTTGAKRNQTPPSTPPLSQPPEMAMLPMTPPPRSSSSTRALPTGLPQNLMDDFVPVSPNFPTEEEEEDAGWGEMSREETRNDEGEADEDDEIGGTGERLIDLDAVAREEMGVWGEREDE